MSVCIKIRSREACVNERWEFASKKVLNAFCLESSCHPLKSDARLGASVELGNQVECGVSDRVKFAECHFLLLPVGVDVSATPEFRFSHSDYHDKCGKVIVIVSPIQLLFVIDFPKH